MTTTTRRYGLAPMLLLAAALDDCFGVPLLRIRVAGRLPDGTQLIPVFPGREPLMATGSP